MKIRFIFNPRSGHNQRNPQLHARAVRFISEHRLDGEVVTTRHPRHATELAAQAVAEGCTLVVAIGGDGTMHEVATALVGTPAILGLIPCGSGNGLGRHLGIRQAGEEAFRTLLAGRPLAIDTGVVNGCPFFNAMGLGFEAEIAVRFNRQDNRGLAGYLRVGVPAFFAHRAETVIVRHPGGTTELQTFTLAIMNSDQYGNDMRIAPGALMHDGRLDLISVPRVGLLGAGEMLYRLGTDTFEHLKTVTRISSAEFVIERSRPAWIHVDGEPREAAARLEIVLRPESLRIMVPVDAARPVPS